MWYLVQTVFLFSTIYFYVEVVKPTNATTGHIIVFAWLLTYSLTWILSKSYDLLTWAIDLVLNLRRRLPPKQVNSRTPINKVSRTLGSRKNLITKVRL